ncbi:MAG: sigma-70 family RNA polymerase sigma factor [Acidobacteriia bacterium]|nr:sigma-70 family RNA polymerase sigma factor [Terriglobia bacterium]
MPADRTLLNLLRTGPPYTLIEKERLRRFAKRFCRKHDADFRRLSRTWLSRRSGPWWDDAAVQDIVGTIFMRTLSWIVRYDPSLNPAAKVLPPIEACRVWLRQRVRDEARFAADHTRRNCNRRRRREEEYDADPDSYEAGDRAADPESIALRRSELAAMRTRLNALAPREQKALLMRANGESYESIGAALEISTGAVRVLVHRARARLSA